MKRMIRFLSAAVMVVGVAGCATTPVAVGPVGPNPSARQSADSMGALQVLTREQAQSDDQNQADDGEPVWYQHTDYSIYKSDGTLVKHVDNATAHYAEAAKQVVLPPGQYLVKAEAKDYSWVEVPVTILRGRTTRVRLDDSWKPVVNAPKQELITLPNGNPVGWRSEPANEVGTD